MNLLNWSYTSRSCCRCRSLRTDLSISVSFEPILHLHHPDVEVVLHDLDLLVQVRVATVHLLANVPELLADLVLEGVQGLSLCSLSSKELSEHVLDVRFFGLSLCGAAHTTVDPIEYLGKL